MPDKAEIISGGTLRLKVPWETFIKYARESLSISVGQELAFDEDSFVKVVSHEGEIRAWDLPDYVYLVTQEGPLGAVRVAAGLSPSHGGPFPATHYHDRRVKLAGDDLRNTKIDEFVPLDDDKDK